MEPVNPNTFMDFVQEEARKNRPNRYQHPDEWAHEILDADGGYTLSVQDIVDYKRHCIAEVEKRDGKRANTLLKHLVKTGQLQTDWWGVEHCPFPITVETEVDGKVKAEKWKVCLRAMTPEDFELWADAEQKRAERDYESRMVSVEGARKIAAMMREQGSTNFHDWASDQQPPQAA